MAIGIVSDSDFLKELENLNGARPTQDNESLPAQTEKKDLALIIEPTPLGRGEGNKEVPESIRKVIAEEALNGSPSKDLQNLFNVKSSSVHAYKNGATSTASLGINPDRALTNHVKKVRARISRRAQNRLSIALDRMTPEKFDEAPLPVLASVANNLAGIIDKMEPREDGDKPNVQFIMYAPRMEREENYAVVEADN